MTSDSTRPWEHATNGTPIAVLLIGTYELGRQSFGLASAAVWLRGVGAAVTCLDLAVEQAQDSLFAAADLVAFHVPMHTATRLAAAIVPRVRAANPRAHLCFFGLYAPMNERYLRGLGAHTILGGEFEPGLAAVAAQLQAATAQTAPARRQPVISLARQAFRVPDRSALPDLARYAYLDLGDGARHAVGYTEASRGCKHTCRHCPVVPVYGGVFRVVQAEIVLEDIAQQVEAGARHISFGDPDFFNGPGHALRIVRALHRRFPDLTYDVTIKIEHLLKQAGALPLLRDTGCLLITSAVEAVDDTILANFDKRHTRADFARAVALCREAAIAFNPTFVTFTPWTTLEGYRDLLATIEELDLVENIAPIQYAIRLLIPEGSLLLELPEVRNLVDTFDEPALCYPWRHPDHRVDELYQAVRAAVQTDSATGQDRRAVFAAVAALAGAPARRSRQVERDQATATERPPEVTTAPRQRERVIAHGHETPPQAPIPRLSEAWYC